MRCPLTTANQRRVLCIFPAYTPSFGTFSHAYSFIAGVRAFMPPQGLLVIAAYMPETWPVRFIDENIAAATAADLAWGSSGKDSRYLMKFRQQLSRMDESDRRLLLFMAKKMSRHVAGRQGAKA